MKCNQRKMVAPDGGWGWIVVLGTCIINVSARSVVSSFGLLFGDLLKELKIQTTGAAVIISIFDVCFNFSGIISAPLIRYYSYRKVAAAGAVLCFIGFTLTCTAHSMTHLIITFSVLYGVGGSFAGCAAFVATNSYFQKRKGLAVGLGLIGTGFGLILLPQTSRLLLGQYGFRGAILITGGLVLHSLVGSCLLRPAKWHLIPETIRTQTNGKAVRKQNKPNKIEQTELINKPKTTSLLDENLQDHIPNKENTSYMKHISVESLPANFQNYSLVSKMDFDEPSIHFSFQKANDALSTLRNENFNRLKPNISYFSTPALANCDINHETIQYQPILNKDQQCTKPVEDLQKTLGDEAKQGKTVWKQLIELFDLDLLKDAVFLNILFGVSMYYVGDQFFIIVLPFSLESNGFSKTEIAYFMSLQAISDIVARIFMTAICDKLQVTKRTLLMIGISLLAVTRTAFVFQTTTTYIMICLVMSGFIRGCCYINYLITIAEYAALEKLPAANGLNMLSRGLCYITLGPILGHIRDSTKSYPLCIHLQTLLLVLSSFMWVLERTVLWFKFRKWTSIIQTTTIT